MYCIMFMFRSIDPVFKLVFILHTIAILSINPIELDHMLNHWYRVISICLQSEYGFSIVCEVTHHMCLLSLFIYPMIMCTRQPLQLIFVSLFYLWNFKHLHTVFLNCAFVNFIISMFSMYCMMFMFRSIDRVFKLVFILHTIDTLSINPIEQDHMLNHWCLDLPRHFNMFADQVCTFNCARGHTLYLFIGPFHLSYEHVHQTAFRIDLCIFVVSFGITSQMQSAMYYILYARVIGIIND